MKNNKIQKATEIVIPIAIPTALVLVIAIVFRNYSNGFKLSLEELLGIVAITTFLIGFSSVRLQSNLEYWKESASRLINRVLEQNANDDLLPLPTNFNQYETDKEKFKPHDRAASVSFAPKKIAPVRSRPEKSRPVRSWPSKFSTIINRNAQIL